LALFEKRLETPTLKGLTELATIFCLQNYLKRSGVGAGGASAPRKDLICQKFGQNLKKFGQRSIPLKKKSNEVIFLCY